MALVIHIDTPPTTFAGERREASPARGRGSGEDPRFPLGRWLGEAEGAPRSPLGRFEEKEGTRRLVVVPYAVWESGVRTRGPGP